MSWRRSRSSTRRSGRSWRRGNAEARGAASRPISAAACSRLDVAVVVVAAVAQGAVAEAAMGKRDWCHDRAGTFTRTGRPPKERRASVRRGFSRTVFMLFSAASATTLLMDAADGHAEDEW
ncbi:unnamed protein product [Ectocarpus sp. 13 AM-2016]